MLKGGPPAEIEPTRLGDADLWGGAESGLVRARRAKGCGLDRSFYTDALAERHSATVRKNAMWLLEAKRPA
jgi:hypothetical protein